MKLKKVINIYGGPGIGKSTIAVGLFYKMKVAGYNVELVSEYAKDLTYEKRINVLTSDQLYIFAKQHRRIFRLKDTVEYIITDSPLLLSTIYIRVMNNIFSANLFEEFIINVNNQYPNINVFLKRNPEFKYKSEGREQNEDESLKIDSMINNLKKTILKYNYISTISNEKTVDFIYNTIQ